MAEVIITWKAWSEMVRTMRRPGWSPCKFALRSNDGEARADFVNGAVHGAFGVCQLTGSLKNTTETGGLMIKTNVPITFAVHLASGTRVGVFADLAEAMDGMEIANHVREWHEITETTDPRWSMACRRVADMWVHMGLVTDDAMSADVDGLDPKQLQGILHRMPELAEIGRPEKLS